MATKISPYVRGTISMDGYSISDAIVVNEGNACAFQAWWETGKGRIKLQESIDRENWTIIEQADIDGYMYDYYSVSAPGHYCCEIKNITSPFIRVKYDYTSGSGTLRFYFHTKRRI